MSISVLSKECTELFIRRLVFATSDSDERIAIDNHLFRFNLWVKFYVAPSDKRDSLDCRLRKAVVPHSLMQNLLTDLLEAINSMQSATCIRKFFSNATQVTLAWLSQPAGLVLE